MTRNMKRSFIGLPGVVEKSLDGLMVHTLSGALRNLGPHRVCSDAGDAGAVTVWIDSAGSYRCAFTRQWVTIDSAVAATKKEVGAWLREWMPRMHRDGSIAQVKALAMCSA